jgi:hypothetical protein
MGRLRSQSARRWGVNSETDFNGRSFLYFEIAKGGGGIAMKFAFVSLGMLFRSIQDFQFL